MVDRSHLEDPLSAGLFKVCDLDDHGKDLHQVDVSAAGVKSPFGCSFKKVSCSSLEEPCDCPCDRNH